MKRRLITVAAVVSLVLAIVTAFTVAAVFMLASVVALEIGSLVERARNPDTWWHTTDPQTQLFDDPFGFYVRRRVERGGTLPKAGAIILASLAELILILAFVTYLIAEL